MKQIRTLRIEAGHFVAGAIWELSAMDEWRCVRCAPILAWMHGKTPLEVKNVLLRKRYAWVWL